MKYIRTKDRIFSEQQIRNTNHNEDGTELTWQDIERIVKWFAVDGKIERIADTIEELCDELVEYGNRPIVITQANVKRGRMSGKTRIILGAIWTEWGLKYVAKMKGILPNGEIDWELL